MAFEEVESNFATPWPGESPTPGQAISGIYCGVDEIPAPGKPGEKFQSFRIDFEGEIFGVSGAVLASKFVQIPVGSLVRVTYKGKQKFASGMSGKDFSVEVDKSVKPVKVTQAQQVAEDNNVPF